ncbi:transcription factor bHLH123-like [Canna indica]|uniref:Transcription factor bHLH123-like n=1 Tax=Canna indica TaxID=4628 RepID=A0AAQ3JLI6_9LILI|nr:transcription factor bHLH123-like [Canna indica]
MAEEFQTRVCKEGSSWWNPERTTATATADIVVGGGGGGGFFGWTSTELSCEAKAHQSCESAGSACGSSITFQETAKLHQADAGIDSTMPSFRSSSSSSSMSWTQALLRHDSPMATSYQQAVNQNFLLDQFHLGSGNESGTDISGGYHMIPASYGCSFQELLDPGMKLQHSVHYQQPPLTAYLGSSNEQLRSTPWTSFSQLLNSSSVLPKQQPNNRLQFTNNTPWWNDASNSAASFNDVKAVCYPPIPLTAANKMNSGGFRDACSSSSTKKAGSEPAIKKPRTETPSPLPSFKVRKEKLGDRITALQQLVSPFGKTDTASVLQETIDYIKFLHDQVGVLSGPYLKDGHPEKQKQECTKNN